MTLIAVQIEASRLEILADGLSCHDRLAITRSRRIGANTVQTDVPGRTTLQKIFPHPHLPFAIAHCGRNQRNGISIRAIVEQFWHRAVSERRQAGPLVALFVKEFGGVATDETILLVGWQAPGTPIVHLIGTDCEYLDGGRYWAGSGRNSLSHSWSDIDSLREAADRFLGECQQQAPFDLPFFANCYGGHWHRLQLTPAESPRWLTEPRGTGVDVSALLPGPSQQISCDNPAQNITSRGEGVKEVLRGTFKMKTVRGALERMADDGLRERFTRLIAIFDEIQLDTAVATVEDTKRYEAAVDDAVVRLIEREVLDQHHRQCALLSRNRNEAFEALLRCYAQILRDLRTGTISKPNDDAKAQTANEGLRGLAHCLRWVNERCPSTLVVPMPAHDVLAYEALELLRWGVAYDPIWNQHSAYSRGLVHAEVEEQEKTITFLPQRHVNPHFFCTQVEAKKADDERLASARQDAQLADLSKTWHASVTRSGQGMRLDDATIRTSGAIDVASSWMERTCLPELADTTSLMGCTVGELRRVLATLYVYSFFLTKLEDVSDDQPALGVTLQCCIVARRRDQMIEWLAGLSGIPAANVEAIVSVLTFDPTHPHVTLAQQPFVDSNNGQLLILPRMLLFLDLPRMYVGALNKIKEGRAVYAVAINEMETAGVESVASEIRSAVPPMLKIVPNATFRLPDGRQIKPDIVVVSENDRAVLVMDVKYATPPFGPADVHRDMEEMEKWKTRMSEYVADFQNNPGVLGQHCQWMCPAGATVFGLILTRWPLPIPVDFADPIGAVDWPSLRDHILTTNPSSIRELMTWADARPDVTVPAPPARTVKNVQVEEWKYRYSVLIPIPQERAFYLTQELAYRLWEKRGRPLWDDQRDWFEAEKHVADRPFVLKEN